jgi:hypothetical protein
LTHYTSGRLDHTSATSHAGDSGEQYYSSKAKLADRRESDVTSRLVTGIPVKAQLKFERVRPELTEAKLLELACSTGYPHNFVVQFRDVLIVQP